MKRSPIKRRSKADLRRLAHKAAYLAVQHYLDEYDSLEGWLVELSDDEMGIVTKVLDEIAQRLYERSGPS